MADSSIISLLFHNRPLGPKQPERPRPSRPTLAQFITSRPVDALDALRRHADMAAAYEREQARHSRPRSFRPFKTATPADRREAA